jgi:hypothetical protein
MEAVGWKPEDTPGTPIWVAKHIVPRLGGGSPTQNFALGAPSPIPIGHLRNARSRELLFNREIRERNV